MIGNPKTRYIVLGSIAFFCFGLVLFFIGGRFIVYHYLFSEYGTKVIGEVTYVGTSHRPTGGTVDFIRYRFSDSRGNFHSGESSGYSGVVGETVLLEYVPDYPFISRVAGEGKNTAYGWRWAIFSAGLLFSFAGIHWIISTRNRMRLGDYLLINGIRLKGTVIRIADGGRTIEYEYYIGSDKYKGKTLALPAGIVKNHSPGGEVEVYADPAKGGKSILKIEL